MRDARSASERRPHEDGHPWWPALLLAATFAAIAVVAWGQSAATAYTLANPCITGWEVPWTIPFTVFHSLGLPGAVAAVAAAFALRGPKTRAAAIICLLVGFVLWIYAAGLMSAPYGWHCDR